MKLFSTDDLRKAVSGNSRSRRLNEDFAYQLSRELVRARISKGLTQIELATKLKTSQSAVARAEAGTKAPTILFLMRLARVYGTQLMSPRFAFLITPQKLSLKSGSDNATITSPEGIHYDSIVEYVSEINTRGEEEEVRTIKKSVTTTL